MFPAGKPAKSDAWHPLVRGVAQAELQVDGRDRRGDVAGVALGDRPEVDALDVGRRRWARSAGAPRGRRPRTRGSRTPGPRGRSRRPRACRRRSRRTRRSPRSRRSGSRRSRRRSLQRRLVLADPFDPHALEQLVVGVVRPVLTTCLRRRRQRRAAWQQTPWRQPSRRPERRHASATRSSRQSRHPTPPSAGGDLCHRRLCGEGIAGRSGPQSPGARGVSRTEGDARDLGRFHAARPRLVRLTIRATPISPSRAYRRRTKARNRGWTLLLDRG